MENNKEKGLVITFLAIFVLFFMTALALSMGVIIFNRRQILEDNVKSSQAYYAAESGIEDSLLLLKDAPYMSSKGYDLILDGVTTHVSIGQFWVGSRTIYSTGNFSDRVKKVKAVYSIDGAGASFFYGAQVGEGGLNMSNGSRIIGSVFSNGSITGSGQIDNDVIVAGNGNAINGGGIHILGNAKAYSCLNSAVDGNLTFVQGGTNSCLVGGSVSQQMEEIAMAPMPISQLQIDSLKSEAEAGGTIGNYLVTGGAEMELGPTKINGSLTISNNATLELTGTVYVTGNIVMQNGSLLELDSSYGSSSGIIVTDGTVLINNNSQIRGTGQSGSYLLVISTNISNAAIEIKNNSNNSLFYASSGGIILYNNAQVVGIAGYKLGIKNNATIQYDIGLENAFFSAGPSGSAGVTEWNEE